MDHTIRDIAISVAREAGALVRQGLTETRTINFKSSAELVTDIDLASEQLIVDRIKQHFPDHLILAEERGADAGALDAALCWAIDPLDGTNNYAHGYPFFSISLALLEAGQPVVGVVYDPLRDECYAAQRGAGAFCNERQLRVSSTSRLEQAMLSTGFPYDRFVSGQSNIAELEQVLMRCQDVRRTGSAALDLCYVAAGRSDGHWELTLNPWDCAAGALLILEAGGQLSNIDGGPWSVWRKQLVATNGLLHAALLAALAAAQPRS